MSLQFGINIVGFATANMGLGVALRNTGAILGKNRVPFGVIDLDPGGNRKGHDLALGAHVMPPGSIPPHPVNLFHMNPPEIQTFLERNSGRLEVGGRLNVCVPYWELPKFPPSWISVLSVMDVILAPSRFIRDVASSIERTLCLHYPQALAELPKAQPDRKRWGFPKGVTVFFSSFDISSGWQRKNPVAAIEAFRRAFPDGGNALLVLKLNNRDTNASAVEAAGNFRGIAQKIPGIRVIDDVLPYADVLSLHASTDVYVSPHRGEGLGLPLMEAMALGKPVIATRWSGNLDFMDEANSCLVGFRMIPIERGTQYDKASEGMPQEWADPSVEEIANWMAKLASSPALRKEIGDRARTSITAFMEQASRGEVFEEVRRLWSQSAG